MTSEQKREKLLHYTMSVVGGMFAMYSLLEHSNVFGSAETSNMILLVGDLLHWDVFHILIRLGSLIVYALGIASTIWLAKRFSAVQKRVCMVIDCAAALVLGLLPVSIHPVIALYPMAFAMSIQWCTFRGVGNDPSATTFSTGNFRQVVTILFRLAEKREREDLHRLAFYLVTMLSFHTGIAAIYLLWPYKPHHSIWFVYIPLACAMVQEVALVKRRKGALCGAVTRDEDGCEDV